MAGRGTFRRLLVLGSIVGAGVFVARKLGLMGDGEESVEYWSEGDAGFSEETSGESSSADDGGQYASEE